MSADNWTECPECMKKDLMRKKNEEQVRDEAYGKVIQEKYLELVRIAKQPVQHNQCLAEYYEFMMMRDKRLFISYSCKCDECSFK